MSAPLWFMLKLNRQIIFKRSSHFRTQGITWCARVQLLRQWRRFCSGSPDNLWDAESQRQSPTSRADNLWDAESQRQSSTGRADNLWDAKTHRQSSTGRADKVRNAKSQRQSPNGRADKVRNAKSQRQSSTVSGDKVWDAESHKNPSSNPYRVPATPHTTEKIVISNWTPENVSQNAAGSMEMTSIERAVDVFSEGQEKRLSLIPNQPEDARILKVAVIGAPNAGKSTLINRIMGWKILPVSLRAHTTRSNTKAVFTEENTQIIFLDTPGVVFIEDKKRHQLHHKLVLDPERSLNNADLIVVIVDAADKWTKNVLNKNLLKLLHMHKDKPSILVLNKVDRVLNKENLIEVAHNLTKGIVRGQRAFKKSQKSWISQEQMIKDEQELKARIIRKYHAEQMKRLSRTVKDKNDDDFNEQDEYMLNMNRVDDDENDLKDDDDFNEQDEYMLNMNRVDDDKNNLKDDDDFDEQDEYMLNMNRVDDDKNDLKDDLGKDETEDKVECDPSSTDEEKDDSGCKLVVTDEFSVKEKSKKKRPGGWYEDVDVIQTDLRPDEVIRLELATYKKQMNMLESVVEGQKGWDGFDEVFMISALRDDGVDDLKSYFVQNSKPGDWQFNSSVVTDEDPHDLACMIVWERILQHCDSYIPFVVFPEILEWYFVEDNELLFITMMLRARNTYIWKELMGKDGKTLKTIRREAQQELRNLFHQPIFLQFLTKIKNYEQRQKNREKRGIVNERRELMRRGYLKKQKK